MKRILLLALGIIYLSTQLFPQLLSHCWNCLSGEAGPAAVSDESVTASATDTRNAFATTVSFTASVLSVPETAGSVTVQLKLREASVSSVDLVVVSSAGTADESDFTLATQTLQFTATSDSIQSITIPINNDFVVEQDEYFVLALENPSGLTVTGTPFITVYIRDNDKTPPVPTHQVELNYIGSYDPSGSNNATSEIVVYDSATRRLFSISAIQNRLDIADFSNPASIQPLTSIDMLPYGGITSVAVRNGIVAVSAPNANPQANGSVVFFTTNGVFQKQVTVGALPDMITFTPDGSKVMTANEGQPNDAYTVDPEGSVSIIDISGGIASLTQANVTTLDFTGFNAQAPALIAAGVRKGFPGSTLSQDLEPEYIAIAPNSATAWVSLQEANAFAVIDIVTKTVTEIWPLGKKDHSFFGNGFDASDRGTNVHIANWPVKGLYMPDGIAAYTVDGTTYIVGANEGDDREYSGFNERVRVNAASYVLDPGVFPNAAILKEDNNLGRLRVTNASGDTDGDGDYDEIHLIGGRSFSIWSSATKSVVYDSFDDFEQYLSKSPAFNPIFNADNESNGRKNRSTSKGPEPEGLVLAAIEGRQYAFITLERVGGVMVYDITSPFAVTFVDYKNPRNLAAYGGDNGPEGIFYISNTSSPDGNHYIIVANEISGTLSVYRIGAETGCFPVGFLQEPVDPAPVYNGAGVATFSVETIGHGSGPVFYQWQENGVDITDGGVYSGATTNTLTITNAGPALNGRNYRVVVSNCLGAYRDTSTSATLTVFNTPLLTVSNITVDEEDGVANVEVCLSVPINKPVSFFYHTGSGTASLLFDYMPVIGLHTIPAGQTCASFSIPIVNNDVPEPTEEFYFNLSFVSNAAVAGPGVITITDFDFIPFLTVSDATVNENDGSATIEICLSNTYNKPVSVFWHTNNGTAKAGHDYSSRSGLVIIPAGQSCATVRVPIGNDHVAEATEFFNVQLKWPFNATIADGTGEVTINDNDGLITKQGGKTLDNNTPISAYPNPFSSSVTVSVMSAKSETATLSLVDMQGRELRRKLVPLVVGNNVIMMDDLGKIAAGTYLMRINAASNQSVIKVIKQ
jgi:hypothetical protein